MFSLAPVASPLLSSRALRPAPRAPRRAWPTAAKRRGAAALLGVVSGLALARPAARAQKVRFPEAVEVEVSIAPDLRVHVLEASLDWQETLIEEAVEQENELAVEADPYGMAVWPAGQVLAQAAAAYALDAHNKQRTLSAVELGCGCGLASLALLALDCSVIATDFRQLPLQLLSESAKRQQCEKRLKVQKFDLRDENARLPEADLVMASDVLYERQTAEAMARRVDEALTRGSTVLVADIGRPNRKVFLSTLQELRPQEELSWCTGTAVHSGLTPQTGGRHTRSDTTVELLELPQGPGGAGVARQALQAWPASLLRRPERHGHVL